MSADRDRTALVRLLGGPETAWLLDRVRARIRDGAAERLSGVVVLKQPTREQRAAIVSLVGPPRRPGETLRVELADVEEVLRRGPWPAGLAHAVETLTGPVVDRRLVRESEAAVWESACAVVERAAHRHPGLARWWRPWCASGGLKRAARAEATRVGVPRPLDAVLDLAERLAHVLDELPASGEPVAVLARRVLGDAHGLDAGRPLGRLATAAAAAAFDLPPGTSRRDVWLAAGVVLSSVSSTVLSLGVPGLAASGIAIADATAAALAAMRDARVPLVLTLDQVRSGGVAPLRADAVVHVCENPTVVEVVAHRWAANRETTEGPVLVCTSGQPSTAVIELLQVLTSRGAECRYHGDFDWGGLRIAGALRQRVPWAPWRYTAADYAAAADRDGLRSRRLVGSPAGSPWEPELAAVMLRHGVAVEEEALSDMLADDVLGAG